MINLLGCTEVEVVCRVHSGAVDDGFEVDVWAGDVTGCAHGCDGLTLFYGVTNGDIVSREMGVTGDEAAWMLNVNAVAIGGEPGCTNDFTALCCVDWGADRTCDVYAEVEVTEEPAYRINTITVEGADIGDTGWPEESVGDEAVAPWAWFDRNLA